jgi:uncharacterized protein YndB with AHSA1/START domain
MSTQAEDLTIRKSVTVDCSPDHAFETYTAGIDNWWPLETHSVGGMNGERPEKAVFEAGVGGRLYERMASGEEREWAKVLVWEPPHRLVYLWHLRFDRSDATEVEVSFEPAGEGTDVTIVHRGWERLGAVADERRERNRRGWAGVVDRYVAAASDE